MALKDEIWWTKKSKIHHETRLIKYELHSQLLLIWYSLFTLGASILTATPSTLVKIGLTKETTIDPNLMIVFSILTLVMSCFVTSLNFKERIIKIKNCYESLMAMDVTNAHANENYAHILQKCENHTERDYLSAKFNEIYSTIKDKRTTDLNRGLTPYEHFKFFRNLSTYYLKLTILYSLPLLIIFISF